MKRLFFIGCLFLIGINVMAYQPIFVDGRVWTLFICGESPYPDSENDTWSDTIQCSIIGDTIIDDQIYKILHYSDGLKSLLRENIKEQKIWKYSEYSKNENLIMDFSLSVGDKLESTHPICENISYIKDKSGNILKQLSFDNNHVIWIEKYGRKLEVQDGATYELLYVTEGNDTLIDFTKKQEYYNPIVVEGYNWNIVNRNASLDADNTIVYSTHVEMFEGDSVVDGVAYKKLWSYKPETPEFRTLEGLIREDVSAQKVWAYGNGIEALMYDFDVEAGDTLSLLGWLHEMKNITAETMEYDETIVDVVVDNVEIVNIGGLEVKKITLFDPQNKERKFDIYERFGSPRGWLRSDFGMVDGGGVNFMVCAFDNNDELLFKPTHNNELDEIEDCYINEIKTNIENITTPNASLQKVIHKGQLLIIKDGKTYNLMGVEVQSVLEK